MGISSVFSDVMEKTFFLDLESATKDNTQHFPHCKTDTQTSNMSRGVGGKGGRENVCLLVYVRNVLYTVRATPFPYKRLVLSLK